MQGSYACLPHCVDIVNTSTTQQSTQAGMYLSEFNSNVTVINMYSLCSGVCLFYLLIFFGREVLCDRPAVGHNDI